MTLRNFLLPTSALALALALTAAVSQAGELGRADPDLFEPRRPTHTYSIVAVDQETGQLGAAVQSHWFNVGSRVIWARPGVGAVATQSFTEVTYGPLGLELMAAGRTAEQALSGLLQADPNIAVRQVGMVDADGHVANHTGSKAIIEHCEATGEGFTVQANLMENDTVCGAMVAAFEGTEGDLAARLMAALEAAQGEGGDIRGKQSAALLVVEGPPGTPQWEGEVFNLRVDDHARPLAELSRLLHTARAYRKMSQGDAHLTEGDVEAALQAYRTAEEMLPDNHEAVFWHAVTLASIGRVEESLPLFRKAFDAWPRWRELVTRLPASELLPDDEALIARIIAVE